MADYACCEWGRCEVFWGGVKDRARSGTSRSNEVQKRVTFWYELKDIVFELPEARDINLRNALKVYTPGEDPMTEKDQNRWNGPMRNNKTMAEKQKSLLPKRRSCDKKQNRSLHKTGRYKNAPQIEMPQYSNKRNRERWWLRKQRMAR